MGRNKFKPVSKAWSLGYMKQPEDGLKWAETCSCGIYVHFMHKLCFFLTANFTLLFMWFLGLSIFTQNKIYKLETN